METHPAVRPFRVDVSEEDLDDLRRRIEAASWPTKELVEDRSQGVQLATMQELARYWETDYDWRKVEEKLSALPQFTTEIDGVDIHFIHVRSQHEDALGLIMTHGWPGSVIELLETVGPLTDPTAHGAGLREVRPRSDPRKEGEAMARSEIMQKIADLSEERERLLAREGSHHTGVGDHRRLAEIDHALGVLWDLRRRELAGEYVRLDEDFLDRYVVSPGDDAPDDYTWAR
jgi:hypothetical protein